MGPSDDGGEKERRAAVARSLGALSGLVPVGIVGVDCDGVAWYHNQRWQDLTASLPSGAGRWYETVHPDDVESVGARWRSRVDRRGQLGEFRVAAPGRAERRCRAECVAMVSSEGDLDGYLVVVSDAPVAPGDVGAGACVPAPALSTPHLLDVVLDRSPDVVTILNADGSWRWSNRAAIRLLGHQERFDPSQGVFGLLHPDDVPAAQAVLDRARAGALGDDDRIELRLRAADGSWRWMEALCDVLVDDPAVQGIVVHLRDLTETRRALGALEATNRRLANLVASMHTAVVLQDERNRVVLANQAFVDLFRLPMTPESLVGQTLTSLGLSADAIVAEPSGAARALAEIRASGRPAEGVRCVLYDGRTIECDFVPVLVQGVDRGHLSSFRDITGQARAEAERERLLASEREENRRLAELDAYRAESIAAVSHELRTPLTSIVGYTQLLRGILEPVASEDQAACLDAIVRNVDRLLRLAGDVVSLDSLESRTMPLPLAGVDVATVVERAAQTVTPEAGERGIKLVVETGPGPIVQGDEDRLAQLVENLLSNAVKFSLPGGRVTVRAFPAGAASSEWDVTVEDTGIGIPEDEIGMLSTRFFRASNARRRGFTGSGLGLSVARAIAERHGGGLAVRSVVGVGTTVTARIGNATEQSPGP
jgi:PAS domain S-box-containing protein